ncbi:ATP-binding protein [Streptomyces sp. NPDC005706]|uniref:ATP-binding protein n=1 Tax=Streptomyces sp. NPDC005706 TaxID=3157169 RepID=UPI0033FD73F1
MIATDLAKCEVSVHPGLCPLQSRAVSAASAAALPSSVPVLRRHALDEIRRWDLCEEVQESLTLVVSELVTNVVLHSASPDVTLLLKLSPGVLTVIVRDNGQWSTSAGLGVREDADCFGRGFTLIEAVTTRLTVARTRTGNWVTAELDLPLGAGGRSPTGGAWPTESSLPE